MLNRTAVMPTSHSRPRHGKRSTAVTTDRANYDIALLQGTYIITITVLLLSSSMLSYRVSIALAGKPRHRRDGNKRPRGIPLIRLINFVPHFCRPPSGVAPGYNNVFIYKRKYTICTVRITAANRITLNVRTHTRTRRTLYLRTQTRARAR